MKVLIELYPKLNVLPVVLGLKYFRVLYFDRKSTFESSFEYEISKKTPVIYWLVCDDLMERFL